MKLVPVSRRRFLTLSGAALAQAALARSLFADEMPPDAARLAAGNARFATDLYARLRTEPGNLFVSPFSISTALAMTSAGAKGKTHEEMVKVLNLPGDAHLGFRRILESLNEAPPAGPSSRRQTFFSS